MMLIGILYIIAIAIATITLVLGIATIVFTYQYISLEYQGEEQKAQKKLSWIQTIFILGSAGIVVLMMILKLSPITMWLVAVVLISGYFGWFAFFRFLFYLFHHESTKAKESFIRGVKLSPLFVGSLVALYLIFMQQKPFHKIDPYRINRTYDKCHEKEDWLVGGECTSFDLKPDDMVGKWQMLPNEDVKNLSLYPNYYFILKANGEAIFHGYYVATDTGGYYDEIEYIEINSSWQFHPKGKGLVASSGNPDKFHPYITIDIDSKRQILFRFDSGESREELYLHNQYDDFDAPHYLTYKHEINGSR